MKRLIISLLSIILLSACQNTTQIKSTQLDTNKQLEPNHGLVAVKIINNADRLSRHHIGWTEVIVVRTDNMKTKKQQAVDKAKADAKSKGRKLTNENSVKWEADYFTLTPSASGNIDTQIFIGSLPQGEYLITTLYSFFTNGDFSSWLTMPVGWATGKFRVSNAKFSDLGALVFQPLLSIKEPTFWNKESEQKAYVTKVDSIDSLAPFIKQHFKVAAQMVDFSEFDPWQASELNDYRLQLAQLSKNGAHTKFDFIIGNAKQPALAAKFGLLKLLQPNMKWKTVNVPSNDSVNAALRENDKLIVATEFGEVFTNKSDSLEWVKSTPMPNQESVVWFAKRKKQFIALTRVGRIHRMHQTSDLDGAWNKIGQFMIKNRSDWLIQNGGLFPFISQDGQIKVLNDDRLYVYKEKPGIWNRLKTDSLVNMKQLTNGTLVGLEVSQWDGIGDQVISYDEGNSWVEINRSVSANSDAKSDASLPTVVGNQIVTVGRDNVTHKFGLRIISQPKSDKITKRKWTVHEQVKSNCLTMLPALTQGSTIFFQCDQGEIVSTNDFGKTWQIPFKSNLDDMQAQYDELKGAIKKELKKEASKDEIQTTE